MFKALFETSVWVDIGIILLIAVTIIAMMKYKQFKYFLTTIIVIVVIAMTIFSGINLNEYYSTSGGIFGEISGLFKPNQVEVITDMSFDFKNVMFTENSSGTYEATFISEQVLDLTTENFYGVFVNSEPCNIIEYSKDYLIATFEYHFLDDDKNILMSDILNFNFAFYKNSTKFVITTDGGSEAVKYWNFFFNKNSFIVNIKQIDDFDNSQQPFLQDLKKCTFKLCGNTYTTVYVKAGQKISKRIGSDIDPIIYSYEGWSIDGINIIDETSISITEDITFVAIATENIYTVIFYVDNSVYETQTYRAYEIIENPVNPLKDGYIFNGWRKSDGTRVDFNVINPERPKAIENLEFFASFIESTPYEEYLTNLIMETHTGYDIDLILEYGWIEFETLDSENELKIITNLTYNHPTYGRGELYMDVSYEYSSKNDSEWIAYQNLKNACESYGTDSYDFELLKTYAQTLIVDTQVYDSMTHWIG